MPHLAACVWCGKLCHTKHKPKITEDTVCSHDCAKKERWFRYTFSDEAIGLQNYRDFGINPNDRGKRHAPDQKPTDPPQEA